MLDWFGLWHYKAILGVIFHDQGFIRVPLTVENLIVELVETEIRLCNFCGILSMKFDFSYDWFARFPHSHATPTPHIKYYMKEVSNLAFQILYHEMSARFFKFQILRFDICLVYDLTNVVSMFHASHDRQDTN